MKTSIINKALPHFIAVMIFLVVAVIYCYPTLEGLVVQQSDVAHWNGANQQSLDFKEKTGHYPLWTNSLFSGMPTFMIGYDSYNIIPWKIHTILTLGLPKPIQFFFLACICFYFMAQVFRIRTTVSILGALAFAYSTYNPVIVSVGHDTKMWSIAYMPALLGSVVLIFQRKYWLGAALTAITTATLIAMNHLQITYYLGLVLAVLFLSAIILWVRTKAIKHAILAVVFTLLGGALGLATNAVSLLSTFDYQKQTIRGGASELQQEAGKPTVQGLDKDYAFSYSMKMSEPFVMMFPRMFGGSNDKLEIDPENSKTFEVLHSFPRELQQQLHPITYWGGLSETGIGTSGPPYVGAIICFLAILGMFVLPNKYRWWMFASVVLAIMMSWGSFLPGFNGFLYDYLPLYNKFRAPSMTLVIPQLILPLMAVLTLEQIIRRKADPLLMPQLKKGMLATGVLFVFMFILYSSYSFMGGSDRNMLQQVAQMNNPQLTAMITQFINAMKEDRSALMLQDIGRSFIFILMAIVLLYLFLKNKIQSTALATVLTLIVFVDLIQIDTKYLNKENYVEEEVMTTPPMTAIDQQINQDKGYYRVYNLSGNRFNENFTSFYHNSIGGYHAAKLRIYQDLIDQQLSGNTNPLVMNMLNAKYIIQTNPQNGQQFASINPDAVGAAWIPTAIKYVSGPKEEMQALSALTSLDTVVVQDQYKASIKNQPTPDSTATISLVENKNDIITYNFSSTHDQLVVLSEIYYEGGWIAKVDGKEVPVVKANYVLRALPVPAGEHEIVLEFKPKGYYVGNTITLVASFALILLLIGALIGEWRNRNKVVI